MGSKWLKGINSSKRNKSGTFTPLENEQIMTHYIDLFSPETYEAFSASEQDVTGFRLRQQVVAAKIHPHDKLICYLTKLSRWFGILEVSSKCYIDETPRFIPENDPFVVRFKVKPLVWLDVERSIPIRDSRIWNTLSFTKDLDKTSPKWTGKLRASLGQLTEQDGIFLESILLSQMKIGELFPVDQQEYEKYKTHTVRRSDKIVTVSVPQDTEDENNILSTNEIRESIKIQSLVANIGSKMGMRIWIPRHDRNAVIQEWRDDTNALLDVLPLNYDETTLRTIEQIDVLWLKGRSIIRAFEVEHTTSIYSGILRMADLLALQPNMDIRLHIVAPHSRRRFFKKFDDLYFRCWSADLYRRVVPTYLMIVSENCPNRNIYHISQIVF
jgi:hypothetical protein